MIAAYDILKRDASALVWIEAVEDLESAKQRVTELEHLSRGQYVVFDQRQQRTVFSCGKFATVEMRHARSQ
jgi:hypothetical protein